ncbi:MAG: hypothetical protein PVH63_13710 [Balneolaceae bacterium]
MNSIKRYTLLFASALLLGFIVNACTTGPDETQTLPIFSSTEAPGDSAHAYLSNDQFNQLNIEIDYMPGYQPNQQALDSLKEFLHEHLNKSSVNIEPPTEIPSGGSDAYDGEDIVNIEQQNRNHYTTLQKVGSDTLWAYFLVLDGQFKNQNNVLGVTYLNTSMAFFGPTIHDNSGGVTQPKRYKLEGTVYMHEMGHNIGLVANGSPMQRDHQDAGNGHHCDNQNCLMYYAVETTDYTSILMDSPMPDLDANCTADLQANGGK